MIDKTPWKERSAKRDRRFARLRKSPEVKGYRTALADFGLRVLIGNIGASSAYDDETEEQFTTRLQVALRRLK